MKLRIKMGEGLTYVRAADKEVDPALQPATKAAEDARHHLIMYLVSATTTWLTFGEHASAAARRKLVSLTGDITRAVLSPNRPYHAQRWPYDHIPQPPFDPVFATAILTALHHGMGTHNLLPEQHDAASDLVIERLVDGIVHWAEGIARRIAVTHLHGDMVGLHTALLGRAPDPTEAGVVLGAFARALATDPGWHREIAMALRGAYNIGVLAAGAAAPGTRGDTTITMMVHPDACRLCKRTYLDAAGRPIPFTVAALLAIMAKNGGRNAGVPAGARGLSGSLLHEWCRCRPVRSSRSSPLNSSVSQA